MTQSRSLARAPRRAVLARSLAGAARRAVLAAALATPFAGLAVAQADKPEIRIGNTSPYTGPAAAFAVIGKLPAAYFRMVNDNGGINGRRINYITYDDAYSPPKTVEQTRRLVESDEVAVVFNSLGAPTNAAIMKYMNQKNVPQLFVASGATKFGDPKNFPWTMGFIPPYQAEGRIFARHALTAQADPKIGVLYQNDDFGRDMLKGIRDGLGARAAAIVAEVPYESTDPTIDAQILKIRSAGANVFMNMTTPKFAAQAIRKLADIGWKPAHYLSNSSNSTASVLKAAGFDLSKGVISSAYMKDPNDPAWKGDPGFAEWNAFLDRYYPDADRKDSFTVYAYIVSRLMEHVLRQCGDDFSRENIMKQAASIGNFESALLLPGIKVRTGPTDFFPLEQLQLIRFNGESYERFGEVIDAGLSR